MPVEQRIEETSQGTAVKDVKPDKRIKKDVVDRELDSHRFITDTYYSSMSAINIANVLGGVGLPLVLGVNLAYGFVNSALNFSENSSAAKNTIKNELLGYKANRLVYRGEGLKAGRISLKKGDNFYHLRLPDFEMKEGEKSTPQQTNAVISQMYSRIFDDLKDAISGKEYKAVAIDLNNEGVRAATPSIIDADQTSREHLYAGKDVVVENPGMETIVLSKEEFEAMSFNQRDIFEKAITALEQEIGDKVSGSLLIEQLRGLKTKTWDEKLDLARKLRVRLDILFNQQAEAMFNGLPKVSLDRSNPMYPIRKKSDIHPVIKSKKTIRGDILEEISYSDGDRRTLVRLDENIEEVIAQNSKYRPLLLSYALSQMLSTPESIRQVTQTEPLSDKEILDAIAKEDLKIIADPKDNIYLKPKSKQTVKRFKRVLLNALITSSLMLAAQSAIRLNDLSQKEGNNAEAATETLDFGKSETPSFSEALPASHLDWKIVEDERNIDSNGYFITSTSNFYNNGRWELNTNKDESVKLDNQELINFDGTTENTPLLKMIGNIGLDAGKNAEIKLPIKNGTTLRGLSLTDLKNNPINPDSYDVLRLKDGTFILKVSLGLLSSSSYVRVSETLVPSSDSPKATIRIPAIDTDLLSKDALEILQKGENSLIGIQALIQSGKYSINPLNGSNILGDIDGTPESYINQTAKLEAMDCDVSNSQFALLSSSIATESYVNMAFGYLHYVNFAASTGNFLDAAASHGFTLDQNGTIYDATPVNVSDDELTNQYVNGNANAGDKAAADEKWNTETENLTKKGELADGLFKLLGLLSIAGGTVIATKGFNFARRNLKDQDINSIRSKTRAKSLILNSSIQDLEEAYVFFNWLSYGGGREIAPDSYIYGPSGKEGFLENMKWGSIQADRVKAYLINPQGFEQTAGISNPTRMRRLARYLVS